MVWRTWSSNVSGWSSSPLIAGIWPAVNTNPLATTAWENGPTAAAPPGICAIRRTVSVTG